MTDAKATARQEAIDWAIRTQDPAFDDWEGLSNWFAADPDNAVMYDQVTIAADEAALTPEPDIVSASIALPSQTRPSRRWLPLALAASVVAAVGGGLMVYRDPSAPALYTLSTAAGGRQSVVIPGAARVELNGDTRVTLDRNDPRFARLERGEALFTVEHDPARPFQLHIGRTLVTDIGTVFDAEQDGPVTRLGVAEGAVRVATAAGSTTVTAGQTVTIEEDGTATVRRSDGGLRVGGWRQGQIDFADISLGRLAARLHRASGARIVVAPDIFDRRVSGSIILGSNPDAALKGIGPLLGISIDRSPDGWIWSGRVRAKPA